jgi:hypothetical protein
MIIIEGMDSTGKSTLARELASLFEFDSIQESEGPPKSPEEINARILRYEQMENTLFVRHPIISNAIYGRVRPEGDVIDYRLRQQFYDRADLLIIYCDTSPLIPWTAHVVKEHDTPEHIEQVNANRELLLHHYRLWAARHAHLIYRAGDNFPRFLQMFKAAI